MSQLVSAIIPTYNRADYLLRSLASVVSQDYRPIEAVVVDDGSVDQTPALIEEHRPHMAKRRVDVIYHRQNNGGAPRARNTAMQLARGSLYAFLDSDDLWLRDFVSTLAALLERYPSAGLAFCGILVIDPEDGVLREREHRLPTQQQEGLLVRPFETILRYMPLQTSGVMVRRSVIGRLGGFDVDLPVGEDWDLWYRIAKEYDFAYTLKALACNRDHPGNLPKYDSKALECNLRLNLRHLPDVRGAAARQALVSRIQRQLTLLQEQSLREGREVDQGIWSLVTELLPRSARYRLGRLVGRGPRWLGRYYAGMIRWAGQRRRERLAEMGPLPGEAGAAGPEKGSPERGRRGRARGPKETTS